MAACEKIWLKGRQCDQFEEWLKTASKKTQKYARKSMYEYEGSGYKDGKRRIVIYVTRYRSLNKRLQNCPVKCVSWKAKIQSDYFQVVQSVMTRIFNEN